MKRLCTTVPFSLCCLLAAPLLAQPQIGGNGCSSATLSGSYDFTITGRQVTSAGHYSSVLFGNGSASFDGLNKVLLTINTATLQSIGTTLTWSGTYTMQSNCIGAVTITSGGNPTLNLLSYNQGTAFLVTGSDAVYSYSGSGSTQPASCSAATLSGVYVFNSTGYSLSSGSVSGLVNGSGLLQFDGVSNVTVNFTFSEIGVQEANFPLTGSYSVSSTCFGSSTLTDSKGDTVVMILSISNSSAANGAFDVILAQGGHVLFSGTGHAAYGQPTPAAAVRGVDGKQAAQVTAGLLSAVAMGWKI